MAHSKVAFVAGPAVTGDSFFGRTEILRSLFGRLRSGTSVLLVGVRRIGKSSILHQAQHLLRTECGGELDWRPLFIPVDGMLFGREPNDTGDAAEWLAAAFRCSFFSAAQDGDQRPKRLLRAIGGRPSLSRLMGALADHRRRSGLPALLFVDEMDTMIRRTGGGRAALVRGLVSAGHVIAVGVVSHWPDAFPVTVPGTSPWFNVFDFMTVRPFPQDKSVDMLLTLSERSGRTFTRRECLFLTDVLGNYPFFLQLVGLRLFVDHSYATSPAHNRTHLLQTATRELVSYLAFHFEYLIDHLPEEEVDAMVRIAREELPPAEESLDRVTQLGLVSKEGDGYQLSSGVLTQFLLGLPRPSLGERIRRSAPWRAVSELVQRCVEKGLEKAVEVGAEKYL